MLLYDYIVLYYIFSYNIYVLYYNILYVFNI